MRFIILLIFLHLSFFSSAQNTVSDAEKIIYNVINQIPANKATLALDYFEYQQYTKGIVKTLDKNTGEPIFSESDYFFEEAATVQLNPNKNLQKTVLGSNFPGFESPYYPLFVTQFYPVSVYKEEFDLFEHPFYNPLSRIGLKNYTFELIETITETNKPYYIIHFSPANSSSYANLSGIFHIDTTSFAIQEATINYLKNKEVRLVYKYAYMEEKALWFPSKLSAEIKLLNNLESFYLFRKAISTGKLEYKQDQVNIFYIESHISEVKFSNDEILENSQINVYANISENEEEESFWKRFRESDLTPTELNIQSRAAEKIKEKGTEKQIERIEDFQMGFLELGFFDLDLKFLVKFNNFEGFRSGIGGVTNQKLFQNFSLGGYLVRGFRDEELKFQVQSSYTFSEKQGTAIDFAYTDDILEIGTNIILTDRRSFSLFEPRLINVSQFYKHNTWELDFRHQINPKLGAEVQLSKSDVSQTFDYEFINDGIPFSEYTLTRTKASFLWTPFGKFIETPHQIWEYEMGYPRFSTQATQSFKGAFNSDFNYTKIDVRVDHLFKHLNQSSTEIILDGNIGFGEIPLTHLYHAYPNSPNKETILRRFSVAGIKSFETMYFGEFFSDKLAMVHLKHRLKPFLIAPWLKPELVLISRHAIGSASNVENHKNITFDTLENGYSESGIELNKLIFGFGASFAYRYGAYHLPKFEDNVSFKFTFNLKL